MTAGVQTVVEDEQEAGGKMGARDTARLQDCVAPAEREEEGEEEEEESGDSEITCQCCKRKCSKLPS